LEPWYCVNITGKAVLPPGLLSFNAGDVKAGVQVFPPSELILKKTPLLPSVHAAKTFSPWLEITGFFAAPKSALKLTAELNVGVTAEEADANRPTPFTERSRASATTRQSRVADFPNLILVSPNSFILFVSKLVKLFSKYKGWRDFHNSKNALAV
jgi:hypothetical protein